MSERFGELFNPDHSNRVNVLNDSLELLEYVDFSRRLRNVLKQESSDKEGRLNWPECPQNINSLENYIDATKQFVSEKWQESASILLQEKANEWLDLIPKSEENKELIQLLSNSQEFDDKLRIQQLGKLEGLRNFSPDGWRGLVLASSERQLAVLSLARHWLKNGLTDEQIKSWGMTKRELEILLDAGGVLGKYIDHAYVKQIELADEPGGTKQTALCKKLTGGERDGLSFLYDVPRSPHSSEYDLKTYGEVFTGEWPKIASGLKAMAKKVAELLRTRELPESYQYLPAYVEKLIDLYQSKEKSPLNLDKQWREIEILQRELVKAGCPLMLIPGATAGVTADADKIDVDFRLGYRTKEILELESLIEQNRYLIIAQQIVDGYREKLKEIVNVPEMIFNVQPFSFGSNLQFQTSAEAGEEVTLSHVNVNNEVAKEEIMPIINKSFPFEKYGIDPAEYNQLVNVDTVLHEIAHNIMPNDDESVQERVGHGLSAAILDEIKAETVGMIVFKKSLEGLPEDKAKDKINKAFYAKLLTVCHYLANKSSDKGTDGEKYYLSGLAVVNRLLESGAISFKNGQYKIIDADLGINEVSKLGQELLDNFYLNENSTGSHVTFYINKLRKMNNNQNIQDFKEFLK